MRLNILSTKSNINNFFGEEPIMAATIRLTKSCNLRCPHCYVNAGFPLKDELSFNEVKSVIDQLSDLKVFYIFYTGGEPFIRRDIINILNYTNQKKIGISISTNGSLLDKAKLLKLKHIPFKLFQISLDGTQEIHDSVRGKGSFKKSLEAIKLAKSVLKKNVGIGTVITKKNWEIMDKIIQLGIGSGADTFTLLCLILTGRADSRQNPTPKEFSFAVNSAFRQYSLNKDKLNIAKDTTIPPLLLPAFLRQNKIYFDFAPCSFPYYLGINSDGSVAPCDGLFNSKDMIIGNIREKPIKEIWKKSKLLKNLRNINPSDLRGVCKKCIYKNYCNGGCRAHAYIKYGNFTMPDPVCQNAYEAGLFPKRCIK